MRDKISDELKDYTTYCNCYYDFYYDSNPFPEQKHYMKRIMNEGYSCYYIVSSPYFFDKFDRKYYKTDYEYILERYKRRKLFCDRRFFPEVYMKYFYIIYNDFLKEEQAEKEKDQDNGKKRRNL